ncbi:Synaptobrevin, partial [Cyphomyrmex costatus]
RERERERIAHGGCEATSRPFIDQSQVHVRNRRGWRVVRRPCSLERSTFRGKSIYRAIEDSRWQSLAKSYASNAERPIGVVAEQADRQIDEDYRNRKSPRRSTISSMATEGGLAPDAAAGPGAGTDGIVGGPRTPQQIASQKRLQATQAQVDEVVDIMKTNVEKVLERDQKLSELDDRADALQQGASQFEQQAGKLKRKFWLQNLKMMIIMGVIGLIILAIIIEFLLYKLSFRIYGFDHCITLNQSFLSNVFLSIYTFCAKETSTTYRRLCLHDAKNDAM